MSKEKIKTLPDLTLDSTKHLEALSKGKEHFYSYQYNVVDKYKSKTVEEIKQELRDNAFPYSILIENMLQDYNISSICRSANAFCAKEIFYIGNKRFDKRGCQGVQNYNDIQWLPTIDDVIALKSKYTFVGCDNIDGAIPINDYIWPPNPLIVIGSEGVGITPTMQNMCKEMVFIKQYGSIRSLNAASASSIIMNDFVTKYRK